MSTMTTPVDEPFVYRVTTTVTKVLEDNPKRIALSIKHINGDTVYIAKSRDSLLQGKYTIIEPTDEVYFPPIYLGYEPNTLRAIITPSWKGELWAKAVNNEATIIIYEIIQ
jgi:hypothetical protein